MKVTRTIIFCLTFGIVGCAQPCCSAEAQPQDLRKNDPEFKNIHAQTIENDTILKDMEEHRENLLHDTILHDDNDEPILTSIKRNASNCGVFLYWNYQWLLRGYIGYTIVTSPMFQSFALKMLPYLPPVACLIAGGIYLYIPYKEKWEQERKEQLEREYERSAREFRRRAMHYTLKFMPKQLRKLIELIHSPLAKNFEYLDWVEFQMLTIMTHISYFLDYDGGLKR